MVAEHLRGDSSLSSLAALNRTSRDIHDSTLPMLYETVRLNTEEDFVRSVGFGIPSGWRYARYVPHERREERRVPIRIPQSDSIAF